jgi:hypothetical protein
MKHMPNGLHEFLVNAKVNTYASSKAPSLPSRPNSKDIHFEDETFRYIDTYLGSSDFVGQGAVWYHDKPIWGMNYYGRMLVSTIPEGFIECLKNALKKIPLDAPYRGPASFKHDRFEYKCGWDGSLVCFNGHETILLNHNEIYTLAYHGGALN